MNDHRQPIPPAHVGREPPAVPDHRLLRRIGAGSSGEVWLAEQTTLHVFRAIKFVWRDVVEGRHFFEREVEGVKCFEPVSRMHEGLVDILQVSLMPDSQGFYYVMELADDANAPHCDAASEAGPPGQTAPTERVVVNLLDVDRYAPRTLLGEIRRCGHLSPREVLEVGIQMAGAVARLHSAGLVHRDIKPGNVVFVDGQPKLADPGLVMYGGEAHTQYGTPGFIPPEGPGKPEADIFSLGKTLYLLATGMPAERFPELPADFGQHADKIIWNRLNDVICRACEKEPTRRYSKGQELLEDLQRIQAGRKLKRRWSVRRVTLAAAALATVALLFVEFFSGEKLLLDERFSSSALDTNRWRLGHAIYPDNNKPGKEAKGWPPYTTNRTLVIENTATSKGGLAINHSIWLETVEDLLKSGESRIEIDLEAVAAFGSVHVSLVDSSDPAPPGEQATVRLFSWESGSMNGHELKRTTLVVELSSAGRRAVVHTAGATRSETAIFDLNRVQKWHLRIANGCGTAAQMKPGQVCLKVHQIKVFTVFRRSRLVGYVTSTSGGLPMIGVVVRNRTTGDESVTGRNGAYSLTANPGANELEAAGRGLSIVVGRQVPFTSGQGIVPHDLAVRRDPPALGDAVSRVSLQQTNIMHFCVAQGHFIIAESTEKVSSFWQIPFDGGPGVNIGHSTGQAGQAVAHGQLFAIGTWVDSYLFEIQRDSSPRRGPPLPTQWPAGMAHDGTNYWIAQLDEGHGCGYALWRWSPQSGLTNRIECSLPISSPAWLNDRLWLLADGVAYEVDPKTALANSNVESAILRKFDTPCRYLSSDGTNLWGLGPDRTLHRLYAP